MTLHDEILNWASGRKIWEQNSLKRLARGGCTVEDVEQVADLCLAELTSNSAAHAIAEVLERGDLSFSLRSDDPASVISISETENVNRIADGQELQFGTDGITLVYGDNGAGKSGYTRVLKKVCFARGD